MSIRKLTASLIISLATYTGAAMTSVGAGAVNGAAPDPMLGRIEVSTIPFDDGLRVRGATYTPSGKVLVPYLKKSAKDGRDISIAVMNDDGTGVRTIFSQRIPDRPKDNGIRFMVFADNQRIFLGDFIIECAPNIDACQRSNLVPVEYPAEVADGEHISHRWSEIIVAPDNEHIAWTTLFASYSAAVFTGKLDKAEGVYRIVSPRMLTMPEAFRADPKHPGGVIPNPVRNGEVKQFVHGGTAISMVGAKSRDTADSVVLDLLTGDSEQITNTPGYNETTIFSPDEQHGIVMSPRFSPASDMAILGLLPRPYPGSLNMGLNMHAYTYSVTGVRKARSGNIGPVLINIEASKTREDYRGANLNTEDEWVYYSPMSWHPDSTRALWLEGRRGADWRTEAKLRMQVVKLLDYTPAPPVAVKPTPDDIPYGTNDLSLVKHLLAKGENIEIKVYGRHSGYIDYRRSASGKIEKVYVDFSDDGESVYAGSEAMQLNPRGYSTYSAKLKLSGPRPGAMDLVMTFGPLHGQLPAELIFEAADPGVTATRGFAEYDGVRLNASDLTP